MILNLKYIFPNKDYKKIKSKLNFPVVIKPFNEGSSVEVYICNEKDFFKNLNTFGAINGI